MLINLKERRSLIAPGLIVMFVPSIFSQPGRAPLGADIYICSVMHYLAVKSSGYVFALRCHLLNSSWPVTSTFVLSATKQGQYIEVIPVGLCFQHGPAVHNPCVRLDLLSLSKMYLLMIR